MHISWVSIVLCLIVFIVGPIVCVHYSKDKTQKRAVLIAFAVLFVVWLVFFIVVEVFLQYSIMPILAAASLIVPVAVYFAIVRSKTTKIPSAQKTDSKQPVAKTVTWEEVIEQQEKRRDMPYKASDEGLAPAQQEATEIADLTPEGEYPLRPDAQLKDDARAQKTPQEVDKEFSKLKQTVVSEKPEVVDEKARTGELTKVSAAKSKPTQQDAAALKAAFLAASRAKAAKANEGQESADESQKEQLEQAAHMATADSDTPIEHDSATESDLEAQKAAQTDAVLSATTESEVTQEESSDVVRGDVKDETEVVVISQPAEPIKGDQAAPKVSFEALQQKADAFAKREIWPLAAKLYEQSSQLAQSDDDKISALFSAMSAYLKAKKLDEVTRLVEDLDAGGGLTPAQTLKLSAIKKMLL